MIWLVARKVFHSGAYVSSPDLQNADPENISALIYDANSWRYGQMEMVPVSLAELQSTAITVFGKKPTTLGIVRSQEDLYKFLHGNINSYWNDWILRHSSLFCRKLYLWAFPRFTEWSVLGTARQLYTLRTGKIGSKTIAGLYCLQELPEKFHPIIGQALSIRQDEENWPLLQSYTIRPSLKRLKHTIACVQYIIKLFNAEYENRP